MLPVSEQPKEANGEFIVKNTQNINAHQHKWRCIATLILFDPNLIGSNTKTPEKALEDLRNGRFTRTK